MWLEQIDFIFSTSWLFKPSLLAKDEFELFSPRGRVKKSVKFAFSSFRSCRAFKIPHFCQKMCLSRFSPCGKFKLNKIWLFKFQVSEVWVLSKSLIFVQRGVWLVFHQAGSSQNEQSLSLQEKTSERCLWASNTLVQKPFSFKFSSFLEENCAADIINEAFKCNTFVGKCCKKRPLSKLYLPTKVSFFQVFQHFRRKLCCRHH